MGAAAQLGLPAREMRNTGVKTSPAALLPDEFASVPQRPGHLGTGVCHLGTGVCLAGGVALHLKLGNCQWEKLGHSPMRDSQVPMVEESSREDAVVGTQRVSPCCPGNMCE